MSIKQETPKALLASKGLNASLQRIRILEHLMGRMDHPNVNMVFAALAGEMPTLSKATVYNALNALVSRGLLTALTITSEEARYDFKREPHHHFLCKSCGSILDVKVKCTYADVAEVEGHRVEDIHGYFKGTCKKCVKEAGDRKKRDSAARVDLTTGRRKTRHTNSKRGG
jgi:Fur family peroxide stress response transcriptional regulator